MPFTPTAWEDYPSIDTPITAAQLNRMETGIDEAHALGEAAIPETIIDAKGDILVGNAADDAIRLAVGSVGQVLSATASSGVEWKGGMVLLAESVLAATAANIDFQNIPAGFKHLFVVGQLRSDMPAVPSDTLALIMNNDTGTNYDRQGLRGNNVTASALNSVGAAPQIIAALPAATAQTGVAGVIQLYIPRYAATTFYKQAIAAGGAAFTVAADGDIRQTVVQWRSTVAITRLTFTPGTGPLAIGSEIALYGMS